MSAVYHPAYAMMATYLDDPSKIKVLVATIRLQGYFAAVVCRFPDVGEPPSSNWVTADRFDVL